MTSTTATYRFAFADCVCVCVRLFQFNIESIYVCTMWVYAFVYAHRTIEMWVCISIKRLVSKQGKIEWFFLLRMNYFGPSFSDAWDLCYDDQKERMKDRRGTQDVWLWNFEAVFGCMFVCLFYKVNVLAKMREKPQSRILFQTKSTAPLIISNRRENTS